MLTYVCVIFCFCKICSLSHHYPQISIVFFINKLSLFQQFIKFFIIISAKLTWSREPGRLAVPLALGQLEVVCARPALTASPGNGQGQEQRGQHLECRPRLPGQHFGFRERIIQFKVICPLWILVTSSFSRVVTPVLYVYSFIFREFYFSAIVKKDINNLQICYPRTLFTPVVWQ